MRNVSDSEQQPKSNIFAGEMALKEPHEIEAERKRALLARVKAVRDGILMHRGKVHKGDPNKHYHWVNIKEDRQIFFKGLGYTIVRDPSVETDYKTADGTHVRGDLVLYEIDKEFWETMEAYLQSLGLERIEGAQQAFEAAAEREGVPVYRPKVK